MTYNINTIFILFIFFFSSFKKVNLTLVLSFKGNNLFEILSDNPDKSKSNSEIFL